MSEPALKLVVPESGPSRQNRPGTPTPDRQSGQDPTPVGPPAGELTDVHPDPGPDSGPGTQAGPGTIKVPDTAPLGRAAGLAGTAAGTAIRLGSHWAAMVREDARRPGGLWQGMYRGKPDSIAELDEYARGHAWVPDGYDGKLIPAMGAFYTHTVAKGGAALGFSIAWITGRFLRLAVFLVLAGIVIPLIVGFS